MLARYLSDGSLDPSFGTGGTVLEPITYPYLVEYGLFRATG